MEIEVLFGPADFAALPARDLGDATCVVFDVLRATSTVVTALANGARAIRPVATIAGALAEKARDPSVLLAGEREGLRIGPELTGGLAFDLGNSPREFTTTAVAGRTIVMTTTNGTRALNASAAASMVVAAAFLNLNAAVQAVRGSGSSRAVLVCSGTGEETALEDVLAAGAFVERLIAVVPGLTRADSACVALGVWRAAQPDFGATLRGARNARRLRSIPDLAPDVDVCLGLDVTAVVPVLRGSDLVEARGGGAGESEFRGGGP